jgi:tetratricopeptide (TPR) repeat protein
VRSAPTNLGGNLPELSGEFPTRSAPALEPLPLPASDAPASPAVAHNGYSQARVDGVSQEAALLRQALTALRRERNPRRALALLDDYDARFREGALVREATSARAQALLASGDKIRALALLDRLPLRQDGHAGELWVIRGELRSLAGRCAEAVRDFDAILQARVSNRDQTARALSGRASCRARLGDAAGAEQDRQRYLREFPQGPAAKQLTTP